jgi:hypothetical protein
VVAERDHIVPIAAAEPVPRLVGTPDAEELRLAAGHVGLVAGRTAAKVTLPGIAGWIKDHGGAAVTDSLEIRVPEASDLDPLLAFFGHLPAGERAFFKEEGARPPDCPALDRSRGPRPARGRHRRGTAWRATWRWCRCTAGPITSARSGSWWPSVHRRHGVGRELARRAVLDALELGLRKVVVEVVAEQEGAVGMFQALGFQAEGLLRDHVRDTAGRLHDLVLLAHSVQDQWEQMIRRGHSDEIV